jgi:hypothetical protein
MSYWVIRFAGYAQGGRSEYDGKYLVSYDPTYLDPIYGFDGGSLDTTWNLELAKKFASPTEAMEMWKTIPLAPYHIRLDGKPNRPLTAFNIEILDEEHAKSNSVVVVYPNAPREKGSYR